MINRLIITFCLILSIVGKGSGQEGLAEVRQLLKIGLDSLHEGKYEAAESLLEKAITSYQNSNLEETALQIEMALALGEVNIEMRDYKAAMDCYQKAVALSSTQNPIDTALLRHAYDGRSWAYSKMYKPLQSIRDLEKVYAIDTALHGSKSRDAANTLMNMGLDYYKAGYFFDAEAVMLEALEVFKVVSEPNAVDFNRIYNNLGIVYRKMGDLDRALIYAKNALEIKLENYPPRHPSVAKYYMNIGTVLTEMGKPEEAVPYLEENLFILKETFPSKNLNITGAKGELANVLADAGHFEEAIKLHLEALETEKELVEETNPYHIAGYFNLAQIYLENNNPQLALDIIKKVEQLENEASYFPFHKKVKTQLLKADILNSLGQQGKAKAVFESQLESIAGTKDFFSKKGMESFRSFQEKELVVQFLEGYASILHHQEKDLEKQWRSLELAVDLLEEIRKGYHSDESSRYLDASSQAIYAAAVHAAYEYGECTGETFFLKKVLQLADKARGNRLKKVLRQQQAIRIAGVPVVLQDSLAQLKLWIAEAEEDYEDAREDGVSKPVIEEKKNQVDSFKEQYWSLLDEIENSYPTYHNLMYGTNSVDVESLQRYLGKEDALMLSYFQDDSYLYKMEISGVHFRVEKLEKAGDFDRVLQEFVRLNNPHETWQRDQSLKTYFENAQQLSRWLLPAKFPSTKRIIVVPFGNLNYLPFELLLKNPGKSTALDFRKADFLIKHYAISYAPSVYLWLEEMKSPKSSDSVRFSGFAPDYPGEQKGNKRNDFSRLFWNKEEVQSIQAFWGGKIYADAAATEANFKKHASLSSILHLAMHASIEESMPARSGLVFYDPTSQKEEFLSLFEIYNMEIPADLLYLNACNTGKGNLVAGEGLVSLAHAFQYAGCKSICLNKWLVDDQAAATIAKAFYQYLKEGDAKDVALQKAKLSYLNNADPLTAHPYYWAGTIIYGDIHPVEHQSSAWWILLVLGFILGSGIFYWIVKSVAGR